MSKISDMMHPDIRKFWENQGYIVTAFPEDLRGVKLKYLELYDDCNEICRYIASKYIGTNISERFLIANIEVWPDRINKYYWTSKHAPITPYSEDYMLRIIKLKEFL
jgi:hypothetical protein